MTTTPDYGAARQHLQHAPDDRPTARAIAWAQTFKFLRALYTCGTCGFEPSSSTEHALWAELRDHQETEHPETLASAGPT
jgi:hypothetical protein